MVREGFYPTPTVAVCPEIVEESDGREGEGAVVPGELLSRAYRMLARWRWRLGVRGLGFPTKIIRRKSLGWLAFIQKTVQVDFGRLSWMTADLKLQNAGPKDRNPVHIVLSGLVKRVGLWCEDGWTLVKSIERLQTRTRLRQ